MKEPSFGVEEAITMGKVNPPSLDKSIFTLGARSSPLVPFTFHVIVWFPLQNDSPPFGKVMARGPASATVTTTSSEFVWPPPAKLSLAVNLKLKVRGTE